MKFIAALDQSGGSTPGALERYGAPFTSDNMMDVVHSMRMRIANSPSFTSDFIDGVILFEDTMLRGGAEVFNNQGIKTYLKVDNGLDENGMMKDFSLSVLSKAKEYGIVGTKMRSVVKDVSMVEQVVRQQFDYADEIINEGFMPIVEPEVDINNKDKYEIECELAECLTRYASMANDKVILKLTIPEQPDQYHALSQHENINKIVALSGGYTTDDACEKLTDIDYMSASFSRALLEGLQFSMTDEDFDTYLAYNIIKIYAAS